MRFAVGIVVVAACATNPAPQRANPNAEQAADAQPAKPAARAPELTPDMVLATIRSRYLGGVERCYRRHLKQDASARGRVIVSFTVDPQGRAREGEARGITSRVDDCIAAQVARWQFPQPAQESRFALGLELGAN